jgi:hypothetical protein
MKQTTHIRDGKRVMRLSDGFVETFSSIRKAKHRSRELQAGGAVLRLGSITSALDQESRVA